MVFLASLPISEPLAYVLALAVPITLISLAIMTSPVIELDESRLVVGRMQLPIEILGPATSFSGEEARFERGPGLSHLSQRLFRGDIDGVVRVEISDPKDPTDYVIFSSRRAAELAVALGADRA